MAGFSMDGNGVQVSALDGAKHVAGYLNQINSGQLLLGGKVNP